MFELGNANIYVWSGGGVVCLHQSRHVDLNSGDKDVRSARDCQKSIEAEEGGSRSVFG